MKYKSKLLQEYNDEIDRYLAASFRRDILYLNRCCVNGGDISRYKILLEEIKSIYRELECNTIQETTQVIIKIPQLKRPPSR